MNTDYGIIILAAGGSRRLGRPKQLLSFKGKSLLENVIEASLSVPWSKTLVVLGAQGKEIEMQLPLNQVEVVYNPEWQTGMASSIKIGLNALLKSSPDIRACVLAVCDQPFVNSGILSELVLLHENAGNAIVASSYEGAVGTPALFGRKYFPDLLGLNGDEGAKKIILSHPESMAIAPFELGKIDIDTEEDYHLLQSSSNA